MKSEDLPLTTEAKAEFGSKESLLAKIYKLIRHQSELETVKGELERELELLSRGRYLDESDLVTFNTIRLLRREVNTVNNQVQQAREAFSEDIPTDVASLMLRGMTLRLRDEEETYTLTVEKGGYGIGDSKVVFNVTSER